MFQENSIETCILSRVNQSNFLMNRIIIPTTQMMKPRHWRTSYLSKNLTTSCQYLLIKGNSYCINMGPRKKSLNVAKTKTKKLCRTVTLLRPCNAAHYLMPCWLMQQVVQLPPFNGGSSLHHRTCFIGTLIFPSPQTPQFPEVYLWRGRGWLLKIEGVWI